MTDSEGLQREADRRRAKLADAVRAYVAEMEDEEGTFFDVQKSYEELKGSLDLCNEAEKRQLREATL
jgi:hypothetical protein